MGATREQIHNKVDEVFDTLDKLARDHDRPYDLMRIMLKQQTDGSIIGCVLVERPTNTPFGTFVTWGVAPYDKGLHSGHYDMGAESAEEDWLARVRRGW